MSLIHEKFIQICKSSPFLRKMNKKTKQNEQKTCLGKSQKKETKLTYQHTKMVNFFRRNKILFYAY